MDDKLVKSVFEAVEALKTGQEIINKRLEVMTKRLDEVEANNFNGRAK